MKITRPVEVYKETTYEPKKQEVVGCWYCRWLRQQRDDSPNNVSDRRYYCHMGKGNVLGFLSTYLALKDDKLREALNIENPLCSLYGKQKADTLKGPEPLPEEIRVDGCYNCPFLEIRRIVGTEDGGSIVAACRESGRLLLLKDDCNTLETSEARESLYLMPNHCPLRKTE